MKTLEARKTIVKQRCNKLKALWQLAAFQPQKDKLAKFPQCCLTTRQFPTGKRDKSLGSTCKQKSVASGPITTYSLIVGKSIHTHSKLTLIAYVQYFQSVYHKVTVYYNNSLNSQSIRPRVTTLFRMRSSDSSIHKKSCYLKYNKKWYPD
mgnify:CR=1 FL=1